VPILVACRWNLFWRVRWCCDDSCRQYELYLHFASWNDVSSIGDTLPRTSTVRRKGTWGRATS